MRDNPVKKKLLEGGVSLGTFIFEFKTNGIARIAAEAGAEFIIFDMEHTGWSAETIGTLIATTPSTIVPLVRLPATEYDFIARALDVGAMGVMVPMVQNAEQAERLVDSAKYPPIGRRGAAFGVAHDDYRMGDVVPTIHSSNSQQLLIAQIETAGGLENVEQIAAVEGIDALWIGQFDLTNSIGIPGQFDHPDYKQALRRVIDACRANNKAVGFMALSVEEGKSLVEQGFRMIAYGGDLWVYQLAMKAGLKAIRQSIP